MFYIFSIVAVIENYIIIFCSMNSCESVRVNVFIAAAYILGMMFAFLMTGRIVNHSKNIVLWFFVLFVVWIGGMIIYYPLSGRKNIKSSIEMQR